MRTTRRRLARDRAGRPLRVSEQRDFADQRAGPGDRRRDRALLGDEIERAFLHHIGAVGVLALAEQRDAFVDVAALGADRQNAQRIAAEQPERRNALQEGDVVLDGHAEEFFSRSSCPASGQASMLFAQID